MVFKQNNIIVLFITLVFNFNVNSQSEIDYKSIDSLGKAFTSRLKSGDIEHLETSKPPENTWKYSRLVAYKNALKANPDEIIIGSFVEPSTDYSYYGYNLFAYRRVDEKTFEYYFAAIVNINVSNGEYKFGNAYLFTEKEALKSWWRHVFGFYYEDKHKSIPEELVFPVCPPPPFKED